MHSRIQSQSFGSLHRRSRKHDYRPPWVVGVAGIPPLSGLHHAYHPRYHLLYHSHRSVVVAGSPLLLLAGWDMTTLRLLLPCHVEGVVVRVVRSLLLLQHRHAGAYSRRLHRHVGGRIDIGGPGKCSPRRQQHSTLSTLAYSSSSWREAVVRASCVFYFKIEKTGGGGTSMRAGRQKIKAQKMKMREPIIINVTTN